MGRGGGEGDYNNATLSHQNDSYIKMDSDESHLNFLLTATDKVTRMPTNHNLLKRKESRRGIKSNRGPSAYQPNALPLGHTGSQTLLLLHKASPPQKKTKQKQNNNNKKKTTKKRRKVCTQWAGPRTARQFLQAVVSLTAKPVTAPTRTDQSVRHALYWQDSVINLATLQTSRRVATHTSNARQI